MIPLFAATTAINTIDSVSRGAAAIWKDLTSSGHAAGKKQVSAGSESFGALLSAHGVADSGTIPSADVGAGKAG